MMTQLVGWLLALPPAAVIVAAFVLPALEASTLLGLVVPGETAVLVAGMTAHSGHLPLWAVIPVAAAGAVVGDQVGFLLGRRWGPALVEHLPGRLDHDDGLERASALLQRGGGWAVVGGRWTALLRAVVPSLAGASGMAPRTFLLANTAGGSTWATAVVLLGYAAGGAYQQVAATLGHAGQLGLLTVLVIGLGALALRRVRRGRAKIRSMQIKPAVLTTGTAPRLGR